MWEREGCVMWGEGGVCEGGEGGVCDVGGGGVGTGDTFPWASNFLKGPMRLFFS